MFYSQPLPESKSWFTPRSQEWESWSINVNVTTARTEKDQIASKKAVAALLKDKLIEISQKTSLERVLKTANYYLGSYTTHNINRKVSLSV